MMMQHIYKVSYPSNQQCWLYGIFL